MVILTRVNVGGVNNFVAGPLYGFTIVLFSGPSQPMMASSGAQMMDPAVQQQGPASAGFGMGGGGGAAQQRIQNLEQQLQREKELLAQQQQGSFIVGCVQRYEQEIDRSPIVVVCQPTPLPKLGRSCVRL